jgi:hypothetical protein
MNFNKQQEKFEKELIRKQDELYDTFLKIAEFEPLCRQAADFAGRPLPDINSLPQEQVFTYPYDDSRPIKQNNNAEPTLRRKELERKLQRIKQLLNRTHST